MWDIHSPRVPSTEEIERLELAEARVGRERLWVNPDCGLKTRQWPRRWPPSSTWSRLPGGGAPKPPSAPGSRDEDDGARTAVPGILTVMAKVMASGQATWATLDLAFYEVADVAVRAWGDVQAADRLRGLVDAIADDGGLIRVDEALIAHAVAVAERERSPPTSPGRRPPTRGW